MIDRCSIREGAVEYLIKPISKDAPDDAFNRIENFANKK
jgi:response regulator of citrate/malate metabolism